MTPLITQPQGLGLILDIIGVYYVTRSFIFSNLKELAAQTWGVNYPEKGYTDGMSGNLFRGLYRQSRDARTGFFILALGFIGQLLGLLASPPKIPAYLGVAIILTAVFLPQVILAILYSKKRLDRLTRGNTEVTL